MPKTTPCTVAKPLANDVFPKRFDASGKTGAKQEHDVIMPACATGEYSRQLLECIASQGLGRRDVRSGVVFSPRSGGKQVASAPREFHGSQPPGCEGARPGASNFRSEPRRRGD